MTHSAATVVFEQLRARLIAISLRIVGNRFDAEDIVQDCFFKWHCADPAAVATPAAWLTTVVQHQSIDYLRRRARADKTMQAALMAEEWTPTTAPALPEHGLLQSAELGAALAHMLAYLSPSERLALVLHDACDCSHAKIGALLGTSAVNARQYLARARRRLRKVEDQALEKAPEEQLCRLLVLRFQAAINGHDVAALATLLAEEQPMAVHAAPPLAQHGSACANDASYVRAA
jgi:RNA polymerase sigma-70 factor (ECF subfamily)